MAGQRQFFAGREDAKPRQSRVLGRLLNENRFRQIHFARDGQHCVAAEAVAVRDYSQRIAFKACGGENVESMKTMFHGWIVAASAARTAIRFAGAARPSFRWGCSRY